jgi:hypothetical protein
MTYTVKYGKGLTYIKDTDGTWKPVKGAWQKTGTSTWTPITRGNLKVSDDTWQSVYPTPRGIPTLSVASLSFNPYQYHTDPDNDFDGNINGLPTKLTVTNTGDYDLIISNVAVNDVAGYQTTFSNIVSNTSVTTPTTLTPGTQYDFGVRVKGLTVGTYTAGNIVFTSNTGVLGTVTNTVPISVTVRPDYAAISVSPNPINMTYTVDPNPAGVINYTSPGTYTLTVPAGVSYLNVSLSGGGGGGGGNDSHPGYAGYPGSTITGTLTGLTVGDVLTFYVGGGGAAGSGGGGVAGGTGGASNLSYNGGTGGASGGGGSSGSGGGGGAASVIKLNGTVIAVAGGGGGGGGGGNYSNGQPQQGYSSSGATAGGTGVTHTDGGGGGGGWKIICTKLYELGLMSKEIYLADQAFGAQLIEKSPDIYNGYRAWAEIVVDWMDGKGPKMMPWMSDEKFAAAAKKWSISWAVDIATPWAEEMAYQMGERLIDNSTGKAIMLVGTPICKVVGVWQRWFGPSKKPAGFGKGLMLIPVFVLLKIVAEIGKFLEKK